MDYTRAITFPFKQHDWIKTILIAGLITLIPIVGIINLIGWGLEISRRVKESDFDLLPKAFSLQYLRDGIQLLTAGLIYSIPFLLISLGINGIQWLISRIFTGFLETIGVGAFDFVLSIVGLSAFFGILFILPSIIHLFLESGQFRGMMNFRMAYLLSKERRQTNAMLMASCSILVVLAAAGISIIFIGIIFTMPYCMAVYAHLTGQTESDWPSVAE